MDKAWETAVRGGDTAAVRRLLAQGADINARDGHGQTALMLAAHAGHGELVGLLLAQRPAQRPALDVTAKYRLSALMLAVVAGHGEIARQLAAAGADRSLLGSGAPGFADKNASDLARVRGEFALAEALQPEAIVPIAPIAALSARCAEHARFRAIDAAFRAGDLAALQAAAGPDAIPHGPLPDGIGACLEYAIYHSPLPFIARLLELGADPNPVDHAGFPPLIAALSCCRAAPGAPGRPDVPAIIELLLAAGADPDQRGINDYTPLHMAVAEGTKAEVALLLQAGADPRLRTRIDDCETPREMAEQAGRTDLAELLARHEAQRGS